MDRSPVPVQRWAQLSYTYKGTLTAGNNIFGAELAFPLNSLYNPAGGSSDQPYGFDQYCPTLYGSFKVYNTAFVITATDPTADGLQIGAAVTPPGSTYTLVAQDTNAISEAPFAAVKDINNTGSQRVSMYGKFPINMLCGVTKDQFDANVNTGTTAGSTGYAGTGSSAPVSKPYLLVSALSHRGGTPTVIVTVKLTYWAQFFDRVTLASS